MPPVCSEAMKLFPAELSRSEVVRWLGIDRDKPYWPQPPPPTRVAAGLPLFIVHKLYLKCLFTY